MSEDAHMGESKDSSGVHMVERRGKAKPRNWLSVLFRIR